MKLSFATLNYFPLQAIYDAVARHLLTQRERSANEIGCLYRGPNGMTCAVGALITDAEYHEDIEESRVCDVLQDLQSLKKIGPEATIDKARIKLLDMLQLLHDGNGSYAKDVKQWRINLRHVVEDFAFWARTNSHIGYRIELSTAVLDEFPNYERSFKLVKQPTT